MKTRDLLAFSVVAFGLSLTPCLAGPCSSGIYDVEGQFDAKLHAVAAAGPAAAESAEATLHHQPTLKSLVHAEEALA